MPGPGIAATVTDVVFLGSMLRVMAATTGARR
jgi:hypothetical protein